MSDIDKIIERVAKLLGMAEDAGSPNEAMIAARRARSLMDKHDITRDDIEKAKGSQFLETQSNYVHTVRHRYMLKLHQACGFLNDCEAVFTSAPSVKYYFQGFKADAIVAKMTMDYLVSATERLLDESCISGRSERNFFRLGFSDAVLRRCHEIMLERKESIVSDGKSLVVSKRDAIIAHFGDRETIKPAKQRDPSKNEINAFRGGYREGMEVGLDKQVDQKDPNARLSCQS